MGRQANLNWMIGAPEQIECPSCKKPFFPRFDDYDIDDDHTNPKPGVWSLHAGCPDCENEIAVKITLTANIEVRAKGRR